MRAALKVYDRLVDGLAALAAVLLTAMALWVTYEVVARYAFAAPTFWVVELSEYTLLYATFLGGPWLVRRNGHVRIGVVFDRLPARVQVHLGALLALVCAVCCAILVYLGVRDLAEAWTRAQLMPGLMQMPRWLVVLCIPVGSLFLTTEFVRQAIELARGEAPAPAATEAEWEPAL